MSTIPKSQLSTSIQNPLELKDNFNELGLTNASLITNTLQGSIWRTFSKSLNKTLVVKVTDKFLHSQSAVIVSGMKHIVYENIVFEMQIQKYLTCGSNSKHCPQSLVKYIDFLESKNNYFFIMEDGGMSLLDFIIQIHGFISKGNVTIAELHKVVKVILTQMIECIEYIHSKNVCHFDISLENFLINDVHVKIENNQFKFDCDNIKTKLCDFGLAKLFEADANCSLSFISDRYCGKPNYRSPEVSNKRPFHAKSNDIFCLGVCIWMMVTGIPPWNKSSKDDLSFKLILNDQIIPLLAAWKRLPFVNHDLITLFSRVLRYQENRCDLKTLKQSQWLQ